MDLPETILLHGTGHFRCLRIPTGYIFLLRVCEFSLINHTSEFSSQGILQKESGSDEPHPSEKWGKHSEEQQQSRLHPWLLDPASYPVSPCAFEEGEVPRLVGNGVRGEPILLAPPAPVFSLGSPFWALCDRHF